MDEKKGVMTALVKMEPGSEIPFHEHTGIEQTLMLEGSLADQDGECKAGMYVWRPAGNRHVARSPNGALMLVMFESPNTYLAGELKGMTMEELMRGRV
jgi:anti-sigma factor ChrR (cupin superfamily)